VGKRDCGARTRHEQPCQSKRNKGGKKGGGRKHAGVPKRIVRRKKGVQLVWGL